MKQEFIQFAPLFAGLTEEEQALLVENFTSAKAAAGAVEYVNSFWKDKKADEWSSQDATRILTNSPWAKSVSAETKILCSAAASSKIASSAAACMARSRT